MLSLEIRKALNFVSIFVVIVSLVILFKRPNQESKALSKVKQINLLCILAVAPLILLGDALRSVIRRKAKVFDKIGGGACIGGYFEKYEVKIIQGDDAKARGILRLILASLPLVFTFVTIIFGRGGGGP
jgi:hypothetical protein